MVDYFTTRCVFRVVFGQYDDIDDQSIHDGSGKGNFDLPNEHQPFIYRNIYNTHGSYGIWLISIDILRHPSGRVCFVLESQRRVPSVGLEPHPFGHQIFAEKDHDWRLAFKQFSQDFGSKNDNVTCYMIIWNSSSRCIESHQCTSSNYHLSHDCITKANLLLQPECWLLATTSNCVPWAGKPYRIGKGLLLEPT